MKWRPAQILGLHMGMGMKTAELREVFLQYFEAQQHTRVASSSLYVTDDPTLLFPNAGMNQFKNLFLGAETAPYNRAATSQKCLRISGKHNDFENVGITPRHHTFFEMLGNFSFGDYFKKEAIAFAWDFLCTHLKLDPDRLWVTIHESDDESEKLWVEQTGFPVDRIVRLGDAENFWSMGDTGPCGPCSEIHYFISADDPSTATRLDLENDTGRFIEIWNLVFMQFNARPDGTREALPKPSVDTGMGLERIAAIVQGVHSTYETDILRSIIQVCEDLSDIPYDGASFSKEAGMETQYSRDVAMRVIADHSRAAAMLIADGILPSSEGRGYVLRRILRRAIRHGKSLAFPKPFLATTTAEVIRLMGGQYPELRERAELIYKVVDAEERKFYETLDAGLALLEREAKDLQSGELFPGKAAFLLHDTYGFPLDLTEDALKPYGLRVDASAFQHEMTEQRERSREDRKKHVLTSLSVAPSTPISQFLGYETLRTDSRVLQLSFEGEGAESGDSLSVIVEETPFYAESGGQVGDTGTITLPGAILRVEDTQKLPSNHIVHLCVVEEGRVENGMKMPSAALCVDTARRQKIALNHSATHLVHAALREVLGDHVHQAGSRVDDCTLRFDYSHFDVVPDETLLEIQAHVNRQIRANADVETEVLPLAEAKARGAMALFGEKYGTHVRVVRIGSRSLELCGGTHTKRSGDIGMLLITHEGGISSGVRRIECITAHTAEHYVDTQFRDKRSVAALLKCDFRSIAPRVEKILERNRHLEKQLEDFRSRLAQGSTDELVAQKVVTAGGIPIVAAKVSVADSDELRALVDRLRLKLGSGVVVLASSSGDRGILVAGVTADLTSKVHAGKLVKSIAESSGGKGGGRPDFAQAGGLDPVLCAKMLDKITDFIG